MVIKRFYVPIHCINYMPYSEYLNPSICCFVILYIINNITTITSEVTPSGNHDGNIWHIYTLRLVTT